MVLSEAEPSGVASGDLETLEGNGLVCDYRRDNRTDEGASRIVQGDDVFGGDESFDLPDTRI